MEPKKKKAKLRNKCPHCLDCEQSPSWGHMLCSYHRQCSGRDEWEPDKCTDCKKQKLTVPKLTENDQKIFFKDMFAMLEDTKSFNQQTIQVNWEYIESLKLFLDNYDFSQMIDKDSDSNITYQGENDNQMDIASHTKDKDTEYRTYTTEYDDPYNVEEDEYIDQNYVQDNYEGTHDNNDQNFNRVTNNQESDFHQNIDNSQVPYTFQNPPYQQPLNNMDIFGNPMSYNNFNQTPAPYAMPVPSAPIYPIQPLQFQPQFYGGIPPRPYDVDPITGESWLCFDPNLHTKKGDNKIELWTSEGQRTVNVQYKIGNPYMFKTLTTATVNNQTPFIDGREGHSVLLTSFNKYGSPNDFGNVRKSPFETRLETGSGLASTLDFFKSKDTEITTAIFDNNNKKVNECFPRAAFEPITVADFTSGWSLTSSSFVAFAKDKELSIYDAKNQLIINRDITIPPHLLRLERESRRKLVNTLTTFHCLDLLGEKIDSLDEHIKTTARLSSLQTKAIGRTMLPNFHSTVVNWQYAKMKVRKAVLKDHTHSNNLRLLRSSLWCDNLFPDSVVTEIRTHGGKNMATLLGFNNNSGGYNNSYSNFQRKPSQWNTTDNYSRTNYRQQQANKTFRDQGSSQKQQQYQQRQSNTSQQTKNSSGGTIKSYGDKNPVQSARGRGRGRGRGAYTKPTTDYKKDVQNK